MCCYRKRISDRTVWGKKDVKQTNTIHVSGKRCICMAIRPTLTRVT